jgi:murein L,D-transpeptidase YcbB/YkuD
VSAATTPWRPRQQLAGLAPLALLALALPALLAGCRRYPAAEEPIPAEVTRLVHDTVEARALPADLRRNAVRLRAWRDLCKFYRARGYLPAWSDGRGPLPRADELLRAIDAAAGDGLDPGQYRRQELASALAAARAALDHGTLADPAVARRIVDLDVHLTYAYVTLAGQLAAGRLRPEALPVSWHTRPRRIEAGLVLQDALTRRLAIAPSLAALAPAMEDYGRLRQALAAYRALAAGGGWAPVPPGPELGPGATGERVAALRARLAATGDLPPAAGGKSSAGAASAVYGPDVAAAVARFRARHGLEAGQTVDAATLSALDVPVGERIRQLEINLERWRWLPGDLGGRYVLINVPDFRLQVVEGGRVVLAMRVIVGKAHSKTPVFSDQMTYLVLNPSWTLPDSIVTHEIAPQVAAHPDYLQRKGLQVVKVRGKGEDESAFDVAHLDAARVAELGRPGSPYRLRQPPGGDNPLGRIKFMFPNRFDVYLHDTPSGKLFARTERDFSHGCVRLEKPLELAEYLLRDNPRWTPQAIADTIASGRLTTVAVPRPLPVHILYLTAWVDKDGTVEFRDDVYGHDAALAAALAAEPPMPSNLHL